MPILTHKPKQEVKPEQEYPQKLHKPLVEPQTFHSNVVDTRYTPQKSLITHIEGSNWKVEYYSQVLGKSNEISPQQPTLDAPYQQYLLITDFELKVTTPLQLNQDLENKEFDVNGEAYVYPSIIPNKGDMFIADIGDGREGLFSLTETQRLTHLKDSTYRINYVLVDYVTQERINDLRRKTIKTVYFVKRLLTHGENPLLVKEELKHYLVLDEYKKELIDRYFNSFFNEKLNTFCVPDQKDLTYDPLLAKTLTAFLTHNDHPLVFKIKPYYTNLPQYKKPVTLFDALLNFSQSILRESNEKVKLVPTYVFRTSPQFQSIYFSHFKFVCLPCDKEYQNLPFIPYEKSQSEKMDLRHLLKTHKLDTFNDKNYEMQPIIHPVLIDDYYVLSENFYHHKQNLSQLEVLVKQAINKEPLNKNLLTHVCIHAKYFNRLEQFYYYPLLLLLIKMEKYGH